mmetsp:Transcript_16725/g.38359  ORF Transcript_16725/g.38359 Transcript_16725/m.38359 type:complete len:262 (+) Transcript_16725:246-1031(+)
MEASSQQQPMPPQQQPMPPPPGMGSGPPPGTPSTTGRQSQGGRGRNNNNGNGGRGGHNGRGGGRTGRGRTGVGGRTLHDVNNPGRGRGGNGSTQQNSETQKIAPNTGIPFGHVPAYLPGSSSLVEELDQRIMVVLRDGRHLIGNLRTFDQYSNMVLDEASERRFHSNDDENDDDPNKPKITYFTDVPLGMYIVRGDSVVLLGQIGSEGEETTEQGRLIMKRLDEEEFEAIVEGDEAEEVEDEDADAEGEQLEWDFDKDLLA